MKHYYKWWDDSDEISQLYLSLFPQPIEIASENNVIPNFINTNRTGTKRQLAQLSGQISILTYKKTVFLPTFDKNTVHEPNFSITSTKDLYLKSIHIIYLGLPILDK